MPNYEKAKVYKIYSPSTGLTYYGSTTITLPSRLAKHIFCFNNKEKYNYNNSSFLVIEKGDYKIELVKAFPCNNRQQLVLEEGDFIRNNECVNKSIAGRTRTEYQRVYREKKRQLKSN